MDIIQVAGLVGSLATIILGVIAIWLSLYFYRRSNELYTALTSMISRVESSSRVTEVATKDIIQPIVATVQRMFQGDAREHVEILRPALMQRFAASLEEALSELPEGKKQRARTAIYKEIDAFLGTLKQKIGMPPLEVKSDGAAGIDEQTAETLKPIPGSDLYDWVPFLRRIRDLQATHKFISVKWLRETKLSREPEMREALQVALDRGMLQRYYVQNPHNPTFPTLGCRLNEDHPVVKKVIEAVG
ncbi:MAG: hypothetical protein HY671_11275 [Chloroflexi bacterium]|nr:hypothetical protein [Chloroflexota bacterium]